MRRMKDSGIEWIGEIPEEWEICRLKFLCKEIKDGTHFSPETQAEGEPYITAGDIHGIGLDYDRAKKISGREFIRLQLQGSEAFAGDVLIVKDGATTGRVGMKIDNVPCVLLSSVARLKSNEITNAKFLMYLLMSDALQEQIQISMSGSAMPRITLIKLMNFVGTYPPLSEQHCIADYLDRKCARIDAVIARQEAVVEKLKEYKLSLITEAVTRGLNPDAPMKDSGVEWIGQIPEHWKVVKFGRCARVVSNLVSPDRYEDYPQIAPDCIEKNSAKLLEVRTVRESGVISWNHLFHKGQIIYSKVRPLLNKVIIAPFDGLCSADMYPIETEENNKFLLYCILSRCFSEQVALVTMDRVKMPKINQNELSNIWMALPPTPEQREIFEYLDGKCDAIDNAVIKKQSLIDLLASYKKSLIYEVVTGKREVPA